MVLVHMTGDDRWLQTPYKPERDVRLIPDPDAGVPAAIRAEIRAAVVKLFANGSPKPVITTSARSMPNHEAMIWTHPGMTTYYRNKSGRVFSAMPWRFVDYWAMTRDADLDSYHLTTA